MKIAKSVVFAAALVFGQAGLVQAGAVLTPLNPNVVDHSQSLNSDQEAQITFENLSSVAVDVYWIDFFGNRVLYFNDLTPGSSFLQETFITHPWLVAVNGSGDTTATGSGLLLAGFMAVTPIAFGSPDSDLAVISGPVPEPETYAMLLAGLGLLGFAARRGKQKAA